MSDAPSIVKQDPAAIGHLPKLGRLASIDPRDRRFALSPARSKRIHRYWMGPMIREGGRPKKEEIYDQGATSACVSYAWNRFLTTHRVINKPPMSFWDFYKRCQREFDEWDGDFYEGTSVRAGAKLLQHLGYIDSYRWLFTVDDIINCILDVGPIVAGTDFTEGMANPDASGFLSPTGRNLGGHAFILHGANVKKNYVIMTNSWGESWNEGGKGFIHFDVLEQLLQGISGYPGDFVTAVEVKKSI